MYSPDTLLLASKKPRIKELIERSRQMSVDEIKLLPEKPDIIKGLLLINEFGEKRQKATISEKIAEKMAESSVVVQGGLHVSCKIYVISVDDMWIPIKSTFLEVKTGWYWAQLEDGRIFISNNLVNISNETLTKLIMYSVFVKDGIVSDISILEKIRLDKLGKTI